MKYKKWLQVICTIILCFILTGCGHEHTWVEASCTEPKTCSECGETEGEPLEHSWVEATCAEPKHCSECGVTEGEPLEHTLTEANYQQPATCEVCGATVGEPLQPEFEKYGLTCNAELDVEYPYTTLCYQNHNYTTTGRVTFTDYEIFTSDDTHEPLEGYEWRAVTTTVIFDDENEAEYGSEQSIGISDYYDIVGYEDSFDNTNNTHSISYNGTDYSDVHWEYDELSDGEWINGASTWSIRIYFRVPIGYDGAIIAWYSSANRKEDTYLYDLLDENSIVFRLK